MGLRVNSCSLSMDMIISVTAAFFNTDVVDHLKLEHSMPAGQPTGGSPTPSFQASFPLPNPASESISLKISLITQLPSSFHPAEDGEQGRGA